MSRADTVGKAINRLEEGESIHVGTADGGCICIFTMGDKGLLVTYRRRARAVREIWAVGECLLAADLIGAGAADGVTILISLRGSVERYHLDGDGGEISDGEILPGILAR